MFKRLFSNNRQGYPYKDLDKNQSKSINFAQRFLGENLPSPMLTP